MGRIGVLVAALLLAPAARAFDRADAARVHQLAAERLGRTTARLSPPDYPRSTGPDGRWRTVPAGDRIGWTQGFLPGSLWLLHARTGEARWAELGARWTEPLRVQETNTQTHDLGFKMFLSFGRGFERTGREAWREVALTSARSLATRFHPGVGIVSCCDWNPDWRLPLVTDTMMNLELLLWAAAHGGERAWADMALSHALRTERDMVRADGSTWHVVDYDPETGAIRSKETFQGSSDDSTWARGHAWAVYGFPMVYRYTRDARMLAAARRVADWWVAHVPEGGVPNWDFDAPPTLKDSSAAAIAAAGLLELAGQVPDGERYRALALRTLDTLASPAYLAEGVDTEAILLHGVGHYPAGQELDVGLVYGDHYLLEAVQRAEATFAPPPAPPPPPPSPPPETSPPEPLTPAPEGCGCGAAPDGGAWVAALAWVVLALRRRPGPRATRRGGAAARP